MKHIVWIAAAAILCAACGKSEPTASSVATPSAGPNTTVAKVGDYELGEPIEAGNVTVVPVMLASSVKDTQDQENHITLSEAKKLGLVEVIEIPGSEEVERLRVVNKSDRPLLLLGGELLLGGKQDRIVAHDTVVPAHGEKMVDVYCVEHGRWEGTSKHFEPQAMIAPANVRDAANFGVQSQVWDSVGDYNGLANAAPETGTLRAGLESPMVNERLQRETPKLAKALESNDRVVGVVFILNGEIKSMDLFGSPKLFQNAKESLLNGYLAEGAVSKNQDTSRFSMSDVSQFLADTQDTKRETMSSRAGTTVTNAKMRGVEMGGAMRGRIVHGTYSRPR